MMECLRIPIGISLTKSKVGSLCISTYNIMIRVWKLSRGIGIYRQLSVGKSTAFCACPSRYIVGSEGMSPHLELPSFVVSGTVLALPMSSKQ